MKIRTQSFILIVGIAAVPVLVLSLAFVVFRISFASREAARFEQHKTEWSEGVRPSDEEVIRDMIDTRPAEIDLAVGDPAGKVIFSTIPGIREGESFGDELARVGKIEDRERILSFGFVPRAPAGYSVVASLPRTSVIPSGLFENYVIAAMLALAAIIAFAATMCISIVRSITTSVLSLEAATRRVAAGELDAPIVAAGSNEMASLARSLNSLREQIKEDQARQSRFIMGISHDLKTPLALVKGYAEAVEESIETEDESVHGYLEIIRAKADQLEGMIDDLIDFVRVDTGEWSQGLSEVELGPFLRSFLRRIEADANLLGHAARGDIEVPDGYRVRMDERLVTRALENLAYNALRYTPEGGRIEISARANGGSCAIRVADDGPGIKAEDLGHIFEPFYRGTSSRREQGMGLGLSIVKNVVESHGWAISVESALGGGAAFTITI